MCKLCIFVVVTQLENSDATLVDLLNDVKNKLAEMQAGEVKLQKEIDVLVKNGINATRIEGEIHDVGERVDTILHHVSGSDYGTTTHGSTPGPTTKPTPGPTTKPTPGPTTKPTPKRIENGGTAGATSTLNPSYAPIKVFSGGIWYNVRNQFPAAIWMRFQKAHRLMKIGFKAIFPNTVANQGNWPKVTEVVGSNDCSQWTTLLYIDNQGGFTSDDEFRMFTIPSQNGISEYACLGLRWPSKEGCYGVVAVGDIQMWEQA